MRLTNERVGVFLARRSVQHLVSLGFTCALQTQQAKINKHALLELNIFLNSQVTIVSDLCLAYLQWFDILFLLEKDFNQT